MGNNPVKFNDPTGHIRVEDMGGRKGCSDDEYCRDGSPKPSSELLRKRHEGKVCDECHSNVPSQKTILNPYYPSIGPKSPDSFWSGFQTIWDGGKLLNNAYDLVKGLDTGTTLLEKGFLWGKAVSPNPGLDFVLGAIGQGISDLDRSNLTIGQRIKRVGVVGTESMITGVISNVVAGWGFLLGEGIYVGGGGIPGYGIGLITSSLIMDEGIWNKYNQSRFYSWGLGTYP